MARRRLFSLDVVDTDKFINIPLKARYLYYELSIRADDDGFVGAPLKIARMVQCEENNLNDLIESGFLIPFDSGVIVITHWNINNTIRKDRYSQTLYQKEFHSLLLENGTYLLSVIPSVIPMVIPSVIPTVTTSKDKLSKGKISKDKKDIKHKFGEFDHVLLTELESSKLIGELGQAKYELVIKKLDEYIEQSGKKYQNHNLTIRKWVIGAVEDDCSKASESKTSTLSYLNDLPPTYDLKPSEGAEDIFT